MRRFAVLATLMLGAALLAGCGQKGPLTLPRAQVTAPVSAASTAAPAPTPANATTATTPAVASSAY